MEQRQLGANGPMVGAVGLGCMSFAGFYGETDEATSHRTLATALDLGVTHLDTANVYGMGRSEEVIGSFIKDHPNKFEIASKGGIWRGDAATRRFNNSEGHLRAELEGSLTRLGVEHITLYYVHRREQEIPIEDVVGTLQKFCDEGKIGGFGFSEISPSSLRRAASAGPVMALQNEYSIWSRQPDMGLIDACLEVGTAFVPFSPVARGMFGTAPVDRSSFKDEDIRKPNPRFQDPNFAFNVAYFDQFKAFAGELGVASATLAMAWVLDQGDHLIPIPGTRTSEHLIELAASTDFKMTDEIRDTINKIMPRGFAHGDRYSDAQIVGVERYC